MKGKLFLPKVFREQSRLDKIRGVYVPFWFCDAEAEMSGVFRATTMRVYSDARYDYTETNYYSLIREGRACFDGVPADGSSHVSDEVTESIEPYDLSQAVDFQTAYLSGFLADRYDVPADVCRERINQRIKNSAAEMLRDTTRQYVSVTQETGGIRLSDGKVRYGLCPVWFLNTVWQGKTYSFAMNGQTGKFVGDLPVSKKAVLLCFLILTLLYATGAFFLLRFFLS